MKLIKNYLWDTLKIDWKEVTVTFNGNKIDLARVVIIVLGHNYQYMINSSK